MSVFLFCRDMAHCLIGPFQNPNAAFTHRQAAVERGDADPGQIVSGGEAMILRASGQVHFELSPERDSELNRKVAQSTVDLPKRKPGESAAKTFQMSDTTRDRLKAGLHGLDHIQQSQILGGIADLSTEIELHCRAVQAGDLRKMWSETLATMFLIQPKSRS